MLHTNDQLLGWRDGCWYKWEYKLCEFLKNFFVSGKLIKSSLAKLFKADLGSHKNFTRSFQKASPKVFKMLFCHFSLHHNSFSCQCTSSHLIYSRFKSQPSFYLSILSRTQGRNEIDEIERKESNTNKINYLRPRCRVLAQGKFNKCCFWWFSSIAYAKQFIQNSFTHISLHSLALFVCMVSSKCGLKILVNISCDYKFFS